VQSASPCFRLHDTAGFSEVKPADQIFSSTRKPWQTTDYQGGEQLIFVCACLTLPDIKVVNLSSKAAKLRYADATFSATQVQGNALSLSG
jgi:hypothetical protein